MSASYLRQKESSSFLKKRSKKLLSFSAAVASARAQQNKSFLVLFFKKEHSSFLLCGFMAIALCPSCKKQDMAQQQSFRNYDRNPLMPNQSTMQNPVPNTLAQENPGAAVPQPAIATPALLTRGRVRYDIFCTPCHGATGAGDGMIVQRGFPHPPDFTIQRLLNAPALHFYQTIERGKGNMYSYADRVSPSDAWAIAAYIRVLQLARHAQVAAQ